MQNIRLHIPNEEVNKLYFDLLLQDGLIDSKKYMSESFRKRHKLTEDQLKQIQGELINVTDVGETIINIIQNAIINALKPEDTKYTDLQMQLVK